LHVIVQIRQHMQGTCRPEPASDVRWRKR
jgi:hypothetical protein